MDHEMKQALCSVLEMLKHQVVHLRRQQGWLIALWETVGHDAQLQSQLKQHPLYDQGPAPFLQSTNATIQNIDALIRQLKGE